MSLFLATIIPAVILLALGGALLWNGAPVEKQAKAALRSKPFAAVVFGIGTAWFLYKVLQLGPADYGSFRNQLFIAFAAIGVGSWYYLPDFLGVRGVCILVLMGAAELLSAAFGLYEIPSRLFMVSIVYVAIAIALWWGASPFKTRDFFDWLWKSPVRPRALGAFMALYGLLLTVVAFGY